MPNTYVALRTETVAVATGTVTFDLTGISGYTDLRIIVTGSTTAAGRTIQIQFNGDTTSGLYSMTELWGSGSTQGSFRRSNVNLINTSYQQVNFSDTAQANALIDIMNYSNTSVFKTVLSRTNSATASYPGTVASVGLWRNTAAITSITLSSSDFAVGSTFSLYGIANADQGAALATGGIITEDSQYWYHTFAASGAFIPKQSLTCDVLVVAGGGGGGRRHGGGGGAGGVSYQAGRSVPVATYNITVGAGGAGGATASAGTTGTNSVFDTITSNGGGGGGGGNNVGLNGGSGGGGTGTNISYPTLIVPGSATQGNTGGATGYGNSGGSGSGTGNNVGGGGGGAGAVGQTATATVAGNGGNGLSTWSTWTIPTGTGVNGFFAGGGGGAAFQAVTTPQGTGGSGGGGAGSQSGNAVAGVTNTGSGGGAQGNDSAASGTGGSGIVIVRYPKV